MGKSSFLSEWMQVLKNKKVLIPIIAVIFVPILYAGMFLWSFWDPYDHLQDVPVAIVNQDRGAFYEGEQLEIGNELVDKLKENDEFQFHFVSKEEGYRDLEKRKYYMIVEIPENFSQNATTLMDDDPMKLTLRYVPNESYNFLSSQIGETAVKEIRAEISKEVSATYAETMFDKVKEVADGLEKASDGSGELDDGAKQLLDGSKELKDNLAVLASSSIEFESGVTTAANGSKELTDGSQELASGIHQLRDASGKLFDASKDVQEGSQSLHAGISQVNNGLQEVNTNIPDLVDGTGQIQAGLKQFQNEMPKQMAETIGEKLKASSKEMNQGLDQLNKGITQSLQNELRAGLSKEISSGIDLAGKELETQIDGIAKMQEQQMKELYATLVNNGVPAETAKGIMTQMSNQSPSIDSIKEELNQKLSYFKGQLNEGINQGFAQATDGINSGFTTYKNEVNKKLNGSTTGLDKEIKTAVDPVFNELSQGLGSIQAGQRALQSGVNQLSSGVQELNAGSTELSNGQQEYVKNMKVFTEKLGDADSGATQLSKGAAELQNGMGQLAEGSSKIADGSQKLDNGSGELVDGLSELNEGSAELHDKLSDAADQTSDVKANDDTYDMIGSPVEVEKSEINPVPNYGTGFAPYFISLGLFVGALLMTIVFNLKEPATETRNGFALFLGKFGVIGIIGVIQALLVDAILLLGLGIEVQSVPLFMLVSIITSLVFMTLIQFLVTTMGDPGRFIAIIILILQLTTSAGTFPLELIPKALQPLNHLLPMTYTVQAFKAVISSGDYAFMWQNIGILLLFILGSMVLTIAYFVIKSKKTYVHAEDAA